MGILALVIALGLTTVAAEIPRQTQSPAQATGTARIRGSVVDASTGTPVRRATMRLMMTPGTASWTAITDGNGAFEFPGLPAGRFTLTASKGGFITLGPGQKDSRERARPIQTSDGSTVDLPPIALPRGGVITGRIVDEYGDFVPEITVQAFRAQYMQGIRRLTSVRSGQTNDIGQYRIYGLQPGTYYVAATARAADGGPLQLTEPGTQAVRGGGGLAPTFFPGTVSAGDAQRIEVTAGTEVPGVDFSLLPVRLARISGVVVDSRGKPANTHAVLLQPARSDGARLLGGVPVTETDADGRFTLENVAPNEYRLDVRATAYFEAVAKGVSGVGQMQGSAAPEFASVPLTVTGEDLAGISVRLTAGHQMTGRVIVEGAETDPRMPDALRVSVMPGSGSTSAAMLAAHAPVAADGSFLVPGLMGRRFVRVIGLPRGWALKSVRAGGMDVTDQGIDIRDNLDGVEIVVTATPTLVSGVVTDTAGALVPEATVVIFPEARERRTGPHNRYVTTVRTGADGRFDVRALPPDIYFVVAVAHLEDGEWAEPENLDRLAAQATRFTLSEGGSTTVALRVREERPSSLLPLADPTADSAPVASSQLAPGHIVCQDGLLSRGGHRWHNRNPETPSRCTTRVDWATAACSTARPSAGRWSSRSARGR